MTIKIYQDKIEIGGYTLQETPTGFSVNGYFDANTYIKPATTGYSSGGHTAPIPTLVNTIDKFPFSTPFTTATDVGDLSQVRGGSAGQSSQTDGYSSGGLIPAGPAVVNTIDKFPFSTPFTTATDAGDLSQVRYLTAGQSSLTEGYTSGGYSPVNSNTIDKFPFSTPFTTATDAGDLSAAKRSLAGQSSSTDGYTSGGFTTVPITVIDKFPFSTPFTTATNVGSLTQARQLITGQSSSTEGYTSGGFNPPNVNINTIDKFPFSTPFTTATDVGDISTARYNMAGQSSPTNGYASGGLVYLSPTATATIDTFSFSTPFTTSTNIGSLSQSRYSMAGQQG